MKYYDENMSYLDRVYERVWDTNFWLPKNITWLELNEYTQFDFNWLVVEAALLACLIYAIRIFFERFISTPIGKFLQVPDTEISEANPQLEAFFKENQVMSESVIMVSKLKHSSRIGMFYCSEQVKFLLADRQRDRFEV